MFSLENLRCNAMGEMGTRPGKIGKIRENRVRKYKKIGTATILLTVFLININIYICQEQEG